MRQARRVGETARLTMHDPLERITATLDADSVRVVGQPGAEVRFDAVRLGRQGSLEAMTAEVADGEGTTRVTRRQAAGSLRLEEWWENGPSGMAQGFVVPVRPTGAGPLVVQQAYSTPLTPTVTEAARTVVFADATGERLRFGGLQAWDAAGQVLAARFVVSGASLDIEVDDAGAAYPVTIDPTWSQQVYLKASNTDPGDLFGSAVAFSGDTMVVGARYEDSAATGVNGEQTSNAAQYSGAVYVFVRIGNTWTQQAYLKASNTERLMYFGTAVAISGDTVVVGALDEDSGSGSYVFVRSGNIWTQQAQLTPTNPRVGHYFGAAVAISGDTVVVGAPWEHGGATGVNGSTTSGAMSSGAAYVFVRSGTTWTQQAYLKASNTFPDHGIYNFLGDKFGSAVAISGDTIVVGAPEEDSDGTGVNGNQANNSHPDAGAAYVFVRRGTNWTQEAYLKASNADEGDLFGGAVAISGDTVVVGAGGEASDATGVNGTQANNSHPVAGAAYVFVRRGTTWTQEAYLKASNADESDSFGDAVAISGDTVVVGAPGEDSAATGVNGDQASDAAGNSGAVYLFSLTADPPSNHWTVLSTGGTQTVEVNAATGVGWVARGEAPWLRVTPGSGTGSGRVEVTAEPHCSDTMRESRVAIAGQVITVSQVPERTRPFCLQVEAVTGTQVTLRWSWAGPIVDEFVLEGGVEPGQRLASLATGRTAPTMTFAAPTGTFYVRVAAVVGGVVTPASEDVKISVNVPAVPLAPVNLMGSTSLLNSRLELRWQNPAGGGVPTGVELDVTGFILKYTSATVTTESNAISEPVSGTFRLPLTETFAFEDVPEGTYTFTVRATNETGSSGSSNPVTLAYPPVRYCMVPETPEALQAYAEGRQLTVRWELPAKGAAPDSYVLTVAGVLNGTLPLGARQVSAPVPPGRYTFTIAAVNGCGTGPASTPYTVVVP
jgi:hypothetical protein